MDTGTAASVNTRSRQARAEVTRTALLEAAMVEFAAHGFEGASTRSIAARAGVHQPQINYHFDSKLDLWRAAVDHLFSAFDGTGIGAGVATAPGDVRSDRDLLARGIATFVRLSAAHPELNRMMVLESTSPGERLEWLVERHVRRRFADVSAVWERLRARGEVLDIDALTAFYLILGGATLVYTNAPEARLLTGVDPREPARIEAHARALVRMLLTRPDDTRPADQLVKENLP
jgi:TetR/AcrR family transcriptional regulator